MEYRNGHAEVRRSRRLVLSFVATVVNYEYCFYWMFYQVIHSTPCLIQYAVGHQPSTVHLAAHLLTTFAHMQASAQLHNSLHT